MKVVCENILLILLILRLIRNNLFVLEYFSSGRIKTLPLKVGRYLVYNLLQRCKPRFVVVRDNTVFFVTIDITVTINCKIKDSKLKKKYSLFAIISRGFSFIKIH